MNTSAAMTMIAIQTPGWRRKRSKPSAIQVQPRPGGSARPVGRKFLGAAAASATVALGAA
jgi:hypothetical protein